MGAIYEYNDSEGDQPRIALDRGREASWEVDDHDHLIRAVNDSTVVGIRAEPSDGWDAAADQIRSTFDETTEGGKDDIEGDDHVQSQSYEIAADADDLVIPIDWDEIDARSDANGIVLADDVPNARKIPAEHECFQLVTHGSPEGLQADITGDRIDISVEQVAAMIEANPDWDHRQVKLFGCSAGLGEAPQELADRLQVPVEAATDTVYVKPNGIAEIGTENAPGYWNIYQFVRQ